MRIKDVIKNVDNSGRVTNAYVIFENDDGKESYQSIYNDDQYNYFMSLFHNQNKNTYNRMPRSERKDNEKKVSVTPKLVSILLAASLAVGGVSYALNKTDNGYKVVDKLVSANLFGKTEKDRFIERNQEKFRSAVTALYTGNFEDVPSFDAEFIKEYIGTCYAANLDEFLLNGSLDGAVYKFNFSEYMPIYDLAIYSSELDNGRYDNIIQRIVDGKDQKTLEESNLFNRELKKSIEPYLIFLFQNLGRENDKYSRLTPFTQVVICEQAKSLLSLMDKSYNFFNHEHPQNNQNRDELIESIDNKEMIALRRIDYQVRSNFENLKSKTK